MFPGVLCLFWNLATSWQFTYRKSNAYSRPLQWLSVAVREKACAQQKAKFPPTAEDLQAWTSPKVFTIGRFKRLLTRATATGRATKTFTYKVNLRCLKLNRAYSISFNSSNVVKFFWSWILKDCIKVQEKKKKVVAFTNMQIRPFYVMWYTCKARAKHVQSCCFACLNPV